MSTNNGVMKSCWGMDLLKSDQTLFIKLDKNKKVIGGYVFEILKNMKMLPALKLNLKWKKNLNIV